MLKKLHVKKSVKYLYVLKKSLKKIFIFKKKCVCFKKKCKKSVMKIN